MRKYFLIIQKGANKTNTLLEKFTTHESKRNKQLNTIEQVCLEMYMSIKIKYMLEYSMAGIFHYLFFTMKLLFKLQSSMICGPYNVWRQPLISDIYLWVYIYMCGYIYVIIIKNIHFWTLQFLLYKICNIYVYIRKYKYINQWYIETVLVYCARFLYKRWVSFN